MEHALASLLNTASFLPDPLETPLGAARWWGSVRCAAREPSFAKPRFDPLLAAELRRLRAEIAALLQGAAPRFRFTGREGCDGVLFALAREAADLAAKGRLSRVRTCRLGGCRRYFFDETKNGSRRWCSLRCMERARAPRRRTIQR